MSEMDHHKKSSLKEEVFLKTIQNGVGLKQDKLEKNTHSQRSLLFTLKNEIDSSIETRTNVLEVASSKNNLDLQNSPLLNHNVDNTRERLVLHPDKQEKMKTLKKTSLEEKKTKSPQGGMRKVKNYISIEKKGISISAHKSKLQKKFIQPFEGKIQGIALEIKESIPRNLKKVNKPICSKKINNNQSQQEQKQEIKERPPENFVTKESPNQELQLAIWKSRWLLNHLDKHNIPIITSISNPPCCIRKVLEALCLVLGEDIAWENVQKVTKSDNLLTRLSSLKIESLPKDDYERTKQILNGEEMQLESIGKVSLTAKYLVEWLIEFIRLAGQINKYLTEGENKSSSLENQTEENSRTADMFSEKILKQIALEEEYYRIVRGSFDQKSLCEFMYYANPPPNLRRLMEAICTILGERKSWRTAQRIVDEPKFIQRLLELKSSPLPYKVYKKVKYILSEEGMDIDNIFSYVGKILLQCATILVRLRELVRGYGRTPEEEAEEVQRISEEEKIEEEKEIQDILKLESLAKEATEIAENCEQD